MEYQEFRRLASQSCFVLVVDLEKWLPKDQREQFMQEVRANPAFSLPAVVRHMNRLKLLLPTTMERVDESDLHEAKKSDERLYFCSKVLHDKMWRVDLMELIDESSITCHGELTTVRGGQEVFFLGIM